MVRLDVQAQQVEAVGERKFILKRALVKKKNLHTGTSSSRVAALGILLFVVFGAATALWGCGASSEPTSGNNDAKGSASPKDSLQAQERRVQELRRARGVDDPETLKAIAALIRLRTAAGDIESGAELFDELIGLDLRTSPILAYATPPIELTRHLGGLGELTAARRQLEASMGISRAKREDRYGFVGEAELALNRLRVALGEVAEEELVSIELTPGPTMPAGPRIRFSDRPAIGKRDWTILPKKDYWSAGTGEHEHFDRILDMSPKGGFETAERLRATALSEDVGLLARIRHHGRLVPEPDRFGGAAWRVAAQKERSTVLLAGDEALENMTVQIQALTRALDRIPSDDERFEPVLEERARLQRERAQALNIAWESEEVHIDMPTTLPGFQKVLDPGTVLLYYMAAGDHTDLIVVPAEGRASKHRISLGVKDLEREIAELISGGSLRRSRGVAAVTEAVGGWKAGASRRLYEALLAPAEPEIQSAARLLIIPDGAIHKLPFAALETSEGAYLAQLKPLALAPSAAVFAALAARRQEIRDGSEKAAGFDGSLVAFGDPDYGAVRGETSTRTLPYVVRSAATQGYSGGLPALPGSGQEVREIGELFKSRGLPVQVHLGQEATEGAAKQEMETAAFVHLAAHGFVNSEHPEHSYLALAVPEILAEGEENGIVEGWEIVDQMQTRAELVTLSACETSVGRERSGEGPSSLNRAFLAAGARSVLASLWKVDDTATSELMVRFYRHLTMGVSKAEALRLAQVELIESSELGYQAPVYWAGFQLTGDWK